MRYLTAACEGGLNVVFSGDIMLSLRDIRVREVRTLV